MFLVKKEVGNQNSRSISLKLTELWHQYACPYMGAHAKFDLLIAPDWPNYNIFWWNLFYMINRHKLHIIVEQELCIYQNVDLRTKKAQNFTKLRLSQNGNFEKCQLQKLKRLLGFLIFSCNFFCSCSTRPSDSLPWSSIFELGPCSRLIPTGVEKIYFFHSHGNKTGTGA